MFQIKNIIQKKISRLKESKNILKLNFFFHKYFGEKDIEIGLNFSNKPDKQKIVQNTIFVSCPKLHGRTDLRRLRPVIPAQNICLYTWIYGFDCKMLDCE